MRNIIQHPNPILKQVSEAVEYNDPRIRELIPDMDGYIHTNTIGIAAVQLGVAIRFIGIRFGNEVLYMVNPVIVKHSEQTCSSLEGCRSITDGRTIYKVTRHKIVKVQATTIHGKPVSVKLRDLSGMTVQHEIDHLDGLLICDKGKLAGVIKEGKAPHKTDDVTK